MGNLYIQHHGIKGMKWGVRRYQNKDGSLTDAGIKRYSSNRKQNRQTKKELKKFEKQLAKSGHAGNLSSMAALSKFGKEDYGQLANLVDSGHLAVKTKFVKNIGENSIDIYVGKEKTPTIRAQLLKGEEFSAKFINKAEEVRYTEFIDYYEKNRR